MNRLYKDFTGIFNDTVKGIYGFAKGQVILIGITFLILSIGFIIIGISLPVLVALGVAMADIIPVVGSSIIMIPWIIICFVSGNTATGTGLAVIYLVFTIARQFLDPLIIGKKIGIRPLYTFFSSVLGSIIFGPLGFVIGPVIAIIINSIFKSKSQDVNDKK